MEELDNDFLSGRQKQPYYPDLHLKSAIRKYDRQFFMKYLRDPTAPNLMFVKNSVRSWESHSAAKGAIIKSNSEKLYGEIFNPILSKQCQFSLSRRKLKENISIASEILVEAAKFLFSGLETLIDHKDAIGSLTNPIISNLTIQYYIYRNFWESVRDVMKTKQIKDNFSFKPVDQEVCIYPIYANAYFLFIMKGNTGWVFDYQQVLMITDNVGSRFMSIFYLELNQMIIRHDLPDSDELLELYRWGDSVLSDLGNEGYNIIKSLEPYCIATYLFHKDPLSISQGYRTKLLESHSSDPTALPYLKQLCSLLDKLVDHPNKLLEIFGCFRHFGHPTVDERAGIEVLKTNSREDLPIDQDCLLRGSGAFNRSFIISFMQKQRRWPKCKIRGGQTPSENFRKLVNNRPLALSEYDLQLSLLDWATLEFEQEFEFEDYEDLVTLLSDTSISPYREHWYTIYARDLLRVSHPSNIPESRRVLLEMIKRPELSCKKIRTTIQEKTDIPEKWLIVGLHSKEREIKIKARLFAMMCIEMRLYFSMTEKNLAEKIFSYIPYQTMTWSDADLSKTLLELTARTRVTTITSGSQNLDTKNVHVIISLDFNKFNQKWRKESTYPIFRTFDELFGTPNLYTYSHEFFESAFFYLSSANSPPHHLMASTKQEVGSKKISPLYFESEYTWQGQKGGCEGLRQKGWTAIIGAMLAANEYDTGLSSWIIGQGDNQVLVVAIPAPATGMSESEIFSKYGSYVEDMVTVYLKNLERLTKGIGMDLKLEESWVSTSLMNYGKELIFSGSYASCGIKKISRAYQEISELYPTLQNRVASLYTSAQACCMKGFDILVPYFLSLVETLNLLDKETSFGTTLEEKLRQLLQKHQVEMSDDLKRVALFLPNECGGLPIIPFPSFMYRGHPDQLVVQLIWLRHLSPGFVEAKRILDLILLGHFMDERKDTLHLIQDPQSVNFKKPILSYNTLKNSLMSSLKTNTKNKMIKELLRNCNEKTLRSQAEYLISARPCFPRVLNEILRLSPDGSMLSFLATFTNMRTMKGLLPPEASHNLITTLMTGDLLLFETIIIMSKTIRSEEYKMYYSSKIRAPIEEYLKHWRQCSTIAAQELRNKSWGLPVLGVTTPHPSEQSSFHLSVGEECMKQVCSRDEFILYVVQGQVPNLVSSPLEEYFKRGTVKHYLGSGTSEKRSGPILTYPKNEKPLRSAQQLLRVKNWIVSQHPSNTLTPFLTDLISSRTDATEEFLILTSGVNYGGSVQHRFSDVTSKHECRPNIRVNFHSRVSICSDELGKYSRGKENYPIIFQSHFLYALCKIHHLVMYRPSVLTDGNIAFHQHMDCKTCLPLIVENPLISTLSPPKVPKFVTCPLVFSSVNQSLTRMPLSVLENIEKITPSVADPIIYERSACVAALILEGNLHISVTPLIHSSFRTQRSEASLVCLTVGFFMKIGMKRLFSWLSKIWLLDNLPFVSQRASALRCSLSEAAESILIGYPDSSWDLIKPYLCVQEIQSELRDRLNIVTTSSDTFLSGKGIGYAISQYLIEVIKKLPLEDMGKTERIRTFKLPILSNAPGLSLSRALFIWVNSIILTSSWRTVSDLKDLIREVKTRLDNTTSTEYLDISKVVITLANVTYKEISLSHAAGICRPIISSVGAEPWIAPSVLTEEQKKKVGLSRIQQTNTSSSERKELINNFSKVGYAFEIPLLAGKDSEDEIIISELATTVDYMAISRSDHQWKLNGLFSTASLKYLVISSKEGLEELETAIHLADGAGGVCRASALVLGAKHIIYNSLFHVEGIMGHRTYHYRPAELQDLHDIKVTGPEICYQTGGNITSANTQRQYRLLISKARAKIGLVTCDAEYPPNAGLTLVKNLITSFFRIIQECKSGTLCIFKTYCAIPNYLKHQVAIFKKNCLSCKIVVPKYSSHENYEVFLVGRYSGVIVLPKNPTISLSEDMMIENLFKIRLAEYPFLRDTDLSLLRSIWFSLDNLGIPLNIYVAIQIFLNHSISQESLRENLLRSISLVIDASYCAIESRLHSKLLLSEIKGISVTQSIRMRQVKKDATELQTLAETIVNANILRDILLHSEVSDLYWTQTFPLMREDKEMYNIVISIDYWKHKYCRSFHKILGYEKYILGNPVIYPEFLRVNSALLR